MFTNKSFVKTSLWQLLKQYICLNHREICNYVTTQLEIIGNSWEHHRKHIGFVRPFLGHFNSKIMETNRLKMRKSSGDYSAKSWYNIFRFAHGRTKNPHFYDLEIFGPVPEPQKQLCFSLETPGYKSREIPKHFEKHISFINLEISEILVVDIFWKGGHRTKNDDPSNQILNILDMGSISSRKHEMVIW